MVTSEKKSSPPNFVCEQCYFPFHSLCRVFFLTLLPGKIFYFNCKARLAVKYVRLALTCIGDFVLFGFLTFVCFPWIICTENFQINPLFVYIVCHCWAGNSPHRKAKKRIATHSARAPNKKKVIFCLFFSAFRPIKLSKEL